MSPDREVDTADLFGDLPAAPHASRTASVSSSSSGRRGGRRRNGETASGKTVKKKTIGVRLPDRLYEDVAAISRTTGQSINAVMDAGLHYYFGTYTQSAEFRKRYAQDAKTRESHFQALSARQPRTATSSQRSLESADEVTATVIRVDTDTEAALEHLKGLFGGSLNDAVIEALELWVTEYPRTRQFATSATTVSLRHAKDLMRLHRDDLAQEFARLLSDLHMDEDPATAVHRG